jgi:divinyl protochlorophyllide a 8-vinyl-reductase
MVAIASHAPIMGDKDVARAGLVGPNSVIQLAHALRELAGEGAAREVFAQAGLSGLLDHLPDEMVDERLPARLFDALWRALPGLTAGAVAVDAGRRTARYILEHRIPRPAQRVLRWLPSPLARRLLLMAIQKHAWTFAGSGRCATRWGSPAVIEIEGNTLSMPGCVWHVAVFETLFDGLGRGRTRVEHPLCHAAGDAVCRFEVHFGVTPNSTTRMPSG